MSVDLFIWSKNKLENDNPLLISNGYNYLGDYYELTDKTDTWTVQVECRDITNEDRQEELFKNILKFVPEVRYCIEIAFMGDVPDDIIETIVFHKLSVELEGILDDPNSGTFQDENGSVVYDYMSEMLPKDHSKIVNHLTAKAVQYETKNYSLYDNSPATNAKRAFIKDCIFLGGLSLAITIFTILYGIINPSREKAPTITFLAIVAFVSAINIIFAELKYKKRLRDIWLNESTSQNENSEDGDEKLGEDDNLTDN
jgi:hypothetical protein